MSDLDDTAIENLLRVARAHREAILLKPGTATAAFRRHLTVTRTALTAGKLAVAGRLGAAAHTAQSAQDTWAVRARPRDLAGWESLDWGELEAAYVATERDLDFGTAPGHGATGCGRC